MSRHDPNDVHPKWWDRLRRGLYALQGHGHSPGDLEQGGALLGQTLLWSGTAWVPGSSGGGGPNLDGGTAATNYGGTTAIDGGTA